MARVNITVPDELYDKARSAGLNVSRVAQDAIRAELARLGKIAELDAYLAELEVQQGPIGDSERTEARAWGGRAFRAPGARPLSMTIVLDSHGLTMLAKQPRAPRGAPAPR